MDMTGTDIYRLLRDDFGIMILSVKYYNPKRFKIKGVFSRFLRHNSLENLLAEKVRQPKYEPAIYELIFNTGYTLSILCKKRYMYIGTRVKEKYR